MRGESDEAAANPFAPPSAQEVPSGPPAESLAWFPVGSRKALVMSICTAGIYTLYWFERQYRFQRRSRGEDISPIPRALFSIFYAKDLFTRISRHALMKDVPRAWDPERLAAVYIACAVIDRVAGKIMDKATDPGLLLVLTVVSIATTVGIAIPVANAQKTINGVLDKEAPGYARNEGFTPSNWIVMALGSTLLLFGIAAPFLGGEG